MEFPKGGCTGVVRRWRQRWIAVARDPHASFPLRSPSPPVRPLTRQIHSAHPGQLDSTSPEDRRFQLERCLTRSTTNVGDSPDEEFGVVRHRAPSTGVVTKGWPYYR